MAGIDVNGWAAVCEAVSELDEPPIRSCPQCSGLCYQVDATYFCPRCGEVAAIVVDDDGETLHVGPFTIRPVTRDGAAIRAGEPTLGYHVSGPGLGEGWTYAFQNWAIDAARAFAAAQPEGVR